MMHSPAAIATRVKVNSWNEWDPLRHVIVGCADHGQIPAPEPAVNAKVPQDSDMRGRWGRRPQETIDRANEELDDFAELLRRRGCFGAVASASIGRCRSTMGTRSLRRISLHRTNSPAWRRAMSC
jgi:hypothetical protein